MVAKVVGYRCEICNSMFESAEDGPELRWKAVCCERLGVPERSYDAGTVLTKPDGLMLHIYVAKDKIARVDDCHVPLYMVDEEWKGDTSHGGYLTGRVVTEAEINRWVAEQGCRIAAPSPK